MEKKIGIYICSGCGIGEAIDAGRLADTAHKEFSFPFRRVHPFLCGPEGKSLILQDIASGANALVLAACSPRVKEESFSFDPQQILLERVNLREQGAWAHRGNDSGEGPVDPDLQMLAEDQVRMAVIRVQHMDLPELHQETISRRILVVGAGITGMTSALEIARAGYEVVLVEKEPHSGGFSSRLHRQFPDSHPYRDLVPVGVNALREEICQKPSIRLLTSATIEKIAGSPGMFDVFIRQGEEEIRERIGAIILAAGFEPYDPSRLGHLGYGKSDNIVTTVEWEKMAAQGSFNRPSDGKTCHRVAFVLCAGSRDPKHLPYCSSVCCLTALKQALYLREKNPEASVFIIYKDIRTPGPYEHFYRRVQEEDGIFFTRGEITSILAEESGDLRIEAADALLGENISLEADMVVLATGMVPRTALGEEISYSGESRDEEKAGKAGQPIMGSRMVRSNLLNLAYRQGPELPDLQYGFPDSHFICFPYETRRTGIYAAGAVRQPMDIAACIEDARGAALKAIQCLELTDAGKAVHPRAGDPYFPELFMQRCTQCKRCTEECPFGMFDEDEKGNPLPNPTRCRRCAICLGSCPERIINFKDYSVAMISSMIKAIEVPGEGEEKPRILVFACENDAYPALDLAGRHGFRYHPFTRVIPLRCLGSLNLVWIADALSKGIDGVLLLGCSHGDDYQCHMMKGSELANDRLSKIQETLDRMALEPGRIRIEEVAISDYGKIPKIMDDFLKTIREIGPNPYKGF